MASCIIDKNRLFDIIVDTLTLFATEFNVMSKLYELVEDIFENPSILPKDKPRAFMRLVDSIENPLVFEDFNLADYIDWQIFIKMFFDQYLVLQDFALEYIFEEPKKLSLLDQIKVSKNNQNPTVIAVMGIVFLEAQKIGKKRFKLSDKEFLLSLSPKLINDLRKQKIHWKLFELSSNEIRSKGLRFSCTHNAKDFHSSASGINSLNCKKEFDHPYIGFHSAKRTQYVGCGNGKDSFFQGVASISAPLDRKIISFAEYFANELSAKAMIEAGADANLVNDIARIIKLDYAEAPDLIDERFKQIYWVGSTPSLLITPLIASSIQVQLHNYLYDKNDSGKNSISSVKLASQRRKNVMKVVRIGSNQANAGRIATKLGGVHYLAKCLPPKQAPDLYWRFYALVKEGRLVGAYNKKSIFSLYKICAVKQKTSKLKTLADQHAEVAAASIASNFTEIVAFARGKGKDWVNPIICDGASSEWLIQAAFSRPLDGLFASLSEALLANTDSEYMNNEVRSLIAGKMISYLKGAI